MATTSTPVWSAPHNGIIGDASAIAGTAAVNQFLVTHTDEAVYQGNSILTPNGTGGTAWALELSTQDVDQPFTMSGTSIGRVTIPLLPVGQGADLLVSLCADNGSGKPGTMICQTRTPASWIYQQSAVAGISAPSSSTPVMEYTGGPLAVAQFSSFFGGTIATVPWSPPAGPDGSYLTAFASTQAADYLVLCGGATSSTNTVVGSVFTVAFDGLGNFAAAVPQPAMPTVNTGYASAVIQTDPSSGTQTLFVAGGATTNGLSSPAVSLVYAAPFDPTSGSVGSWSAQANLPTAVVTAASVAWGSYVYLLGGATNTNNATLLNTVQFAQVSNGQITSWANTTPLPSKCVAASACAIGDFLVVSAGVGSPTYYYAPINSNGTLGAWVTLTGFSQVATVTALGSYGGFVGGAAGAASFTMSPDGPSPVWAQQGQSTDTNEAIGTGGAGQWQFYAFSTAGQYTVDTYPITLTPQISVPLPATGLTSGATYHILMQQQGGDLNDYLRTHVDHDAFPGNPTALASAQGAYTWTALTPSGSCVPIQVFNNTPPATVMPGIPWYLWEDNGARITALVTATTPDRRLLGVCEATKQAYALNQNQGFETGISPWTVYGGTVAQSSTETYASAHSAQVTPSGTAASVYLDSEQLACMPGQWVSVVGWMWFTSAVTAAQASLSVNWYSLGGTYMSTSSNSVTVPAQTWTEFTNTFQAPAGAYQCTINPTLGGTPASSQVFYIDTIHAHYAYTGPQLSVVTQVDWPGTWPTQGKPTGSTVLA